MVLLVFYIISFLIVVGALGVVFVSNPFYSVLLLIFTFFNAAALYVILDAEFLAAVLVIVYVGAIAVLFLFTVMLINVKSPQAKKRRILTKQFFLSLLLVIILSVEMFFLLYKGIRGLTNSKTTQSTDITSIAYLGAELFNDYYYVFILSAIILTLAMIGAVIISEREKYIINKRQNISEQNLRSKENSVKSLKVNSEAGIK